MSFCTFTVSQCVQSEEQTRQILTLAFITAIPSYAKTSSRLSFNPGLGGFFFIGQSGMFGKKHDSSASVSGTQNIEV